MGAMRVEDRPQARKIQQRAALAIVSASIVAFIITASCGYGRHYYTIIISIVAISALFMFILIIACDGEANTIPIPMYQKFRALITLMIVIYAIISINRIATQMAIPQRLEQKFVHELIGFLIFWVLVPPLWFFFEYFATKNRWIENVPGEFDATTVKDYSDFSSKIWAAVLAVLVGLIALNKH
jgi:hypothetical protein